jgi:hypothetical protein
MSLIQEHEYRGIQIGISWKALDGQRGYLYLDYNNSLSCSSSSVTYWLSPRSREWKNINRRAALEVLAIDTERLNQNGRDAGPGEILRYDTGPAKIDLGSGECKIGIWTMTYVRNEDKLIAVSISALKSRLVASAVVSGPTVDEQVSDALLDRLMTVPNIVEALQDKVKINKGKEAKHGKLQAAQKQSTATSKGAADEEAEAAVDRAARLTKAVNHLKLLWQRMKDTAGFTDADFPREMTIMCNEMTAQQRDSFFILTGVFIEEVIMELMRGLVVDPNHDSQDAAHMHAALSVGEFVRIWDTLQGGNTSPQIRQAAKDCFEALSAGLDKSSPKDSEDIKHALSRLYAHVDTQPVYAHPAANGKGKGKKALSKAGQGAMDDAMDWLRTLWTRANNDLAIQEHEIGTFLEVCIQTLPEEIKSMFDKLDIDKSTLAVMMREEIGDSLAADKVPSASIGLSAVQRSISPGEGINQAISDLRSIVMASLRQGGFSTKEVPALIQSAIKTMPPATKAYYENLGVNMDDAAAIFWAEFQNENPPKGQTTTKSAKQGKTALADTVKAKSNAPTTSSAKTKEQPSTAASQLVEGMMAAARSSMFTASPAVTSYAPPAELKNNTAVKQGKTAFQGNGLKSTGAASAQALAPLNVCVVCSDQARFECSRCHEKYCSEACQRDDWAQHKSLCKKAPV